MALAGRGFPAPRHLVWLPERGREATPRVTGGRTPVPAAASAPPDSERDECHTDHSAEVVAMQPDPEASSASWPGPSMEQRGAAVWLVDLRQAWPVLLVRAVLAVALGLVALTWPGITLVILA